jgi:hypothetical protein
MERPLAGNAYKGVIELISGLYISKKLSWQPLEESCGYVNIS